MRWVIVGLLLLSLLGQGMACVARYQQRKLLQAECEPNPAG